ncbi:hypothetical protein Rcae01_02165 [Novipirellula caenicola]|uniref:Uncharacterized protein n=1 Tax=Novipirellula caenicola TaxID=1536901 RepID=A0ABP9VND5_9BACT
MDGASELVTSPHPDEALRARPTSPVLRSGEVADGDGETEETAPAPGNLHHDRQSTVNRLSYLPPCSYQNFSRMRIRLAGDAANTIGLWIACEVAKIEKTAWGREFGLG